MPLYAYRCASCDHEFETLVRSDDTPQCPSCGGVELSRLMSLIAKPAPGGDVGAAPCSSLEASGGCGACPAFADCG